MTHPRTAAAGSPRQEHALRNTLTHPATAIRSNTVRNASTRPANRRSRHVGAERRFVGPLALDDLNAVVERIAGELRAEGRKPYLIPVGGSSPLGASAYATTAEEIVADLGHDDVLEITAPGSGGTQAGLAARLGHGRVLGIDVGALSDPATAVRRLTTEVAGLLDLPVPAGEPRIVDDQIGGANGAMTGACLSAMRITARTEGLLLDPSGAHPLTATKF